MEEKIDPAEKTGSKIIEFNGHYLKFINDTNKLCYALCVNCGSTCYGIDEKEIMSYLLRRRHKTVLENIINNKGLHSKLLTSSCEEVIMQNVLG